MGIASYNAKEAKVGDRLIIESLNGGFVKVTVDAEYETSRTGQGWIGIWENSEESLPYGWIKAERIVGRATQEDCIEKIPSNKLYLHLE